MPHHSYPSGSLPSGYAFELKPLVRWALSPGCRKDLESIFGPGVDAPAAAGILDRFAEGDFSCMPAVEALPASSMPGLWGGYSREERRIFLSAECPPHLVQEILLEEIGHFLDHELCASETPGDEGALFAAAVLGRIPAPAEMEAWASEEDLQPVSVAGRTLLVEAARKVRGNAATATSTTKPRTSPTPNSGPNTAISQDGTIVYALDGPATIRQTQSGQRLIGSRKSDTFVVTDPDVKIEDPYGEKDTVDTVEFAPSDSLPPNKWAFSIEAFRSIEHLRAGGNKAVSLTGNILANSITGNSAANRLDGGVDTARDTLSGGLGDDTYVIRDALDVIVETGGIDTIETTISNYVLNVANVENVAYIGTGSSTLTGNALANILTGGTLGDTLIGGGGNTSPDTLRGGQGDDVYLVSRQSDRIEEGNGPLDGIDTIRTTAATYSMANFANVEVLTYAGSAASRLTGNSGNNTVNGGRLVRNTIDGGAGDDYIIGGNTADSLVGGLGNDTLVANLWLDTPVGALGTALLAGGGTDTLNGGAGDDWYVVNSQTAYTFVDPSGKDTIASTVSYSLKYNKNISDNIENLYLIGKDSLSATGSDSANTITGNDGNNVISAGGGNDTVFGGLGGDFINGEAGGDTIFGGGQPQTDLPASAATAITLKAGESYTGKIESRRDSDWIRAELMEGVVYTFELTFTPQGNPALVQYSDAGFGQSGRDLSPATISQNWWFYFNQLRNKTFHPFIGDAGADLDSLLYSAGSLVQQTNHFDDHGTLVLDSTGNIADGAINYDANDASDTNANGNVIRFTFTPFADGEYYIPVSGAGPLGGAYTVTLTDPDTTAGTVNAILADDGRNTLMGGLGADYLVAGNGRDSLGADLGDILLGGTNGVPGGNDQDSSSDTLIGGDGGDLLDGGKGIDSMIGGGGNDTYFIDSSSDLAVEADDGGQADLGIFSYAAAGSFSQDLADGLFALTTPDFLDSVTGAGFDVDLANNFSNIEHASLMGAANVYVLGNGDPNSLHGNFGNNLLVGANGDDSLFGQGGNDYLVGGDGGDLLDGGSGQNTMDGGLGSDTYIVNDRNDRILNEIAGLDGGEDHVLTFFNFDPIQGTALEQFQPDQPDNSPSVTKSISFASRDLSSFYNIENFDLRGQAAYGVGNALGNKIRSAPGTAALLLGMGGDDSLFGTDDPLNDLTANDSLFGDTPAFYASPDIYALAPTDTRTQTFLDSVVGEYGNDYLDGGRGDDYLDGGLGFDLMIGGFGNDTFVQDNVDDLVIATVEGGSNGVDELISSVNIAKAPDGISKIMLVVANQHPSSGQAEVASFASFLGSQGGNQLTSNRAIGGSTFTVENANVLELIYSPRATTVFSEDNPTNTLVVDAAQDDLDNPGKKQFDLAWTAAANALETVAGYTVEYTEKGGDGFWKTYVHGKSQDFQGNRANPRLTVKNLEPGEYEFKVTAHEIAIPALEDRSAAQHVTLQGGGGNDAVIGTRYAKILPGWLAWDSFTDPLFWNNPIDPAPPGFIFNPAPFENGVQNPFEFATYLDGGFGNDFLDGALVNDGSGHDYTQQGVTFRGLNTLVGGQGSDTFVVNNGGKALGDEFDWVIKYGNETPVVTQTGNVGSSLNGGQHNLVVSLVDYLTLSDTVVHQGKFIDQLNLADFQQFGMGNRLDNYIYETSLYVSSKSTLVGNTGRDSIVGSRKENLLVGGTAYGMDNVGLAIRDFASVADGGNGLTNSIFRDTDPIPSQPNGIGLADPGQFWFVPGYYGAVYDPDRNRDTLVSGGTNTTLDGGAGADSLVGSGPGDGDDTAARRGDTFIVSQGSGGNSSRNINAGDAVFGNGGNDTVVFTDSDYLWWSGHQEGAQLAMNGYTIGSDISNLVLQMGAPTARDATGNRNSTGNDHTGWFEEAGSNLIVGNEFDNILDGGGVGGDGNVGGFDTLTGMGGSDLFVISGYRGASNNKWEPSITDFTDGPNAGQSLWDASKSEYTDADFVLITDFTPDEDFLELPGTASNYWIGAAPSGYETNNVRPLTGTGTPSSDSFGIYRSASYGFGAPDLVAHIRTAGGVELDTNSLVAATPGATGLIPTGTKGAQFFGWGTFYRLDNAAFDNGTAFSSLLTDADTFRSNTQTPSTASLSVLINQIV